MVTFTKKLTPPPTNGSSGTSKTRRGLLAELAEDTARTRQIVRTMRLRSQRFDPFSWIAGRLLRRGR